MAEKNRQIEGLNEKARDLEENLKTLRKENKKKQDRLDANIDSVERRKAEEMELERDKSKQLKMFNNLHSDYAALQRQLKETQDTLRDTEAQLTPRALAGL